MTNTIKITTELTFDNQFLYDIMTTAVEGGISYWAGVRNLERDDELNVTSFTVTDDEHKTYDIDTETLLAGIKMVFDARSEQHWPTLDQVCGYLQEEDACMIDADAADFIIQFTCFNDIVYG